MQQEDIALFIGQREERGRKSLPGPTPLRRGLECFAGMRLQIDIEANGADVALISPDVINKAVVRDPVQERRKPGRRPVG